MPWTGSRRVAEGWPGPMAWPIMFGRMLDGVTVCTGVAVGPARLRGYELEGGNSVRRVPAAHIDEEVDRFRSAVQRSIEQVTALRDRLAVELGATENRILDVHLAYLRDASFVDDIERRIRGEQLGLEDALAQGVRDFDRIFELVESERMKERALDLRDVALRVIRNLVAMPSDEEPSNGEAAYVLVSRTLSIADLFGLDHENVLGIVAEEGGVDSHAGIVARSMGIPTVTGVRGAREHFRDGDLLVLDAGGAVVYVNPDERLRREYETKASEPRVEAPFESEGPAVLGDGTEISLAAACGNLGEVGQARDGRLDGIGLYRTELLFLVDPAGPGEDLLLHHYKEVVTRFPDGRVCFRLLDLTRAERRGGSEPNPALGEKGVRLLLADRELLRRQLRALMRLAPQGEIDLLVPFVSSVLELRRLKEAVRSLRAQMIKEGEACADRVRIGAVVEVPATAFHVQGVALESDFLVVALDDLQQYVLAADRDNLRVADDYRSFHPALFALLSGLARDAEAAETEISLFGEVAADPLRLPFYLGAGYRRFVVSPVRAPGLRQSLERWTEREAHDLAVRVLECETSLDVQKVLLEAQR